MPVVLANRIPVLQAGKARVTPLSIMNMTSSCGSTVPWAHWSSVPRQPLHVSASWYTYIQWLKTWISVEFGCWSSIAFSSRSSLIPQSIRHVAQDFVYCFFMVSNYFMSGMDFQSKAMFGLEGTLVAFKRPSWFATNGTGQQSMSTSQDCRHAALSGIRGHRLWRHRRTAVNAVPMLCPCCANACSSCAGAMCVCVCVWRQLQLMAVSLFGLVQICIDVECQWLSRFI